MALFEFFEKSSFKWIWFFGILISSFIPLILRAWIGYSYNIIKFDIKDLLFAALAMNLSNFNLVNGRKPDVRIIILFISGFIIVLVGVALGNLFRDEAEKTNAIPPVLFYSSIVFSILSVVVSFEANNYTLKNSS